MAAWLNKMLLKVLAPALELLALKALADYLKSVLCGEGEEETPADGEDAE